MARRLDQEVTMTTLTTDRPFSSPLAGSRGVRLTCLFGGLAGGAAGLTLLFSNPLGATRSGAAVTAALQDSAVLLQGLAIAGVYAAAALGLAAVTLGLHIGGTAGRVVSAAGSAVAVLLAAYLAAFGAGAIVASLMLDSAGAGLGESTLLSINIVEVVRYAPSLGLVVAALTVKDRLPKSVSVSAALLAVLLVVPMTSWIAALLTPAWLGLSAAAVRRT